MPMHITQYTATHFQLGVGFSALSDHVKVPNICVSIQEPVQNSPIRPSAILSAKAKAIEHIISPKNALKMSVLALLKKLSLAEVVEISVFGGRSPEENYIFVV